jgi:hypothetical protein
MTKKLRFIIYSLGLIIFVFFSVSFLTSLDKKATDVSPTPVVEVEKQAYLVIFYGNETASSYQYIFTEEKTAFDILKDIAEEENIPIETQQYDFGVFVKSIGDFENTDKMAWIYFVNGKAGTVASDQYKLNDDDLVEWKYIVPEVGD